jgi:predicted nucleic acid-binding Zn ribbon protein
MPGCHDMKEGEIYYCEDCGLELKVVKECKNAYKPVEECECCQEHGPTTFSCCGIALKKK